MQQKNGRFPHLLLFAMLLITGLTLAVTALSPPLQADDSAVPTSYIIRFHAPAVVFQQAAGQNSRQPFTMNTAAQRTQQALLQAQDQALAAISKTIQRRPLVRHQYTLALNGLAVELTPAEAKAAAALPEIASITPEPIYRPTTDAGPTWVGAPGVWDGSQTGGLPGSMGEGMIIGVIDTGINMDHPSFATVGGDGYAHTNPLGPGQYLGHCASQPETFNCNDKLIGAYSWPEAGDSPEDDNGHGSHVASIAAGNVLTTTYNAPTLILTATLSGVAPHANLIAYDVCEGGSCFGGAAIAAIEIAISETVDVLNYSIGSLDLEPDPWADPVAEAFLAARAAGIFVAAAAGNDGPDMDTINTPANAPWLTAVGNTSHHARFDNLLGSFSGGSSPLPDLMGSSITAGYGPAPIVSAAQIDATNAACLNPFPANTFSQGEIVYCEAGGSRLTKGLRVLAAGGGGIVVNNDVPTNQLLNFTWYDLPGVNLRAQDAAQLVNWLNSGAGHTAVIGGTERAYKPEYGDEMFWESSRGPNPGAVDVLKPNVVAPGTKIWGAYRTSNPANPPEFNFYNGTSQASPHVAGAAALLLALHPDWTPAEVESALMTTAVTAITDYDETPAGTFTQGSGRIDIGAAARAGLVLHESAANFQAADPALGGSPGSLNLAGLAAESCAPLCAWTRTFRSTAAGPTTWRVTADDDDTIWLDISPERFTLAPGEQQTVTITAGHACWQPDAWRFAAVWLADESGLLPAQHIPVAVKGTCEAIFLPLAAK